VESCDGGGWGGFVPAGVIIRCFGLSFTIVASAHTPEEVGGHCDLGPHRGAIPLHSFPAEERASHSFPVLDRKNGTVWGLIPLRLFGWL
jgi:hypothetical protein